VLSSDAMIQVSPNPREIRGQSERLPKDSLPVRIQSEKRARLISFRQPCRQEDTSWM
jgi:hypothetical protein